MKIKIKQSQIHRVLTTIEQSLKNSKGFDTHYKIVNLIKLILFGDKPSKPISLIEFIKEKKL